ncbi:Ig-like domain-containing protein, partial [Streptococcus anginosus]|uniref:Ig-like domain-containing protein n=1 Tax=Streptococcus anginosus TaxID=1328 RepID=UPI0021F9192D
AELAADGTWSVDVPGSALVADEGRTIAGSVVVSDAAGNTTTAEATKAYEVDTVAPVMPTLTINDITEDNVINAAEADGDVTVSGKVEGEFREGDVVTLTINGTAYTAELAADGTWSVDVPGSALVA